MNNHIEYIAEHTDNNSLKHKNRQKPYLLIVILLLVIVCNIECSEQINTNNLIRIHVLANSNSQADQQLKMQVKDDVLRYLQPLLAQSSSIDENRAIIRSNLPQIRQAAQQSAQQHGSSDLVTLQYGYFDFPVKSSGNLTLPEGNYEALRILIGNGKGRNWWCVLFPPLCFTDSNVVIDDANAELETEVVFKLKSIEWWKNHCSQ